MYPRSAVMALCSLTGKPEGEYVPQECRDGDSEHSDADVQRRDVRTEKLLFLRRGQGRPQCRLHLKDRKQSTYKPDDI